MLTSHGYQTSFNIGAYLRRQYIDRYSLLPPRYSPSSLVATSNSQQATVDSLHTVVLALYPNASNVSIQLVQDKAGRAQNKGIGSDMLGTRCRKLVQLQGKLQLLQENKGKVCWLSRDPCCYSRLPHDERCHQQRSRHRFRHDTAVAIGLLYCSRHAC